MASNFFEQQDVARKNTGRLVALFAAAVLLIVLLVYGLLLLVFAGGDNGGQQADVPYLGLFVMTAVGVMAVVGGCSLYKIAALRQGGGESVARMLGGTLLHPDTTETNERKILNVVEEMALASGTPVPPVYLMEDEPGINAFAAGYAPDRAVIGITRGAVEQLSRDELQGVVAHEFSHILNGDMRLNIRLMGVIFGLIALAVIGRVLLHSSFYSSSRRRRSNDNKGQAAILVIGLGLLVIGGIGVLFGRLIQAAVSRQREFLADASAVQFTRNPDTIGGALKRIGGGSASVKNGHSGEVSHMFIASAASSWGFGPLATHPPIEKRIKRIDPSWDGTYPEPRDVAPRRSAKDRYEQPGGPIEVPGAEHLPGGLPGAIVGAAILGEAAAEQAKAQAGESAVDQVGSVSPTHVAYMRELLAGIPSTLKQAAHETYGARAVIYAVLLDKDKEVREAQMSHLAQHAEPEVTKLTGMFVDAAHQLQKAARLPLVDLAVPALREMSDKQYEAFQKDVETLINADGRVDLFEWVLQRLLIRHLDVHFHPAPDPKVKYYALKPLAKPCAIVLSVLAHIGNRDGGDAQAAFESGIAELGVEGISMLDRKGLKLPKVGEALDELQTVSPREKQKVIRACAKTIAADGEVNRGEGELMRAVADSLGVPMPPLLPGQKLV